MKFLIIPISICCIILACKDGNKTSIVKTENISFNKYLFPEDSFWYDIKKKYDFKLNLRNLEFGADSLEFRFWVDNQLSTDNVYIFKYENSKVIARNIFFIDTLYDPEFNQSLSKLLETKVEGTSFSKEHLIDLGPKFQLNNILKKYDLFNFPTQSSLKGYKGCCLDGVVYFFEIATKHYYKFSVYENPECCMDQQKENKIFLDFLYELQKSLPEYEYCWPMCKPIKK